MSLDKRVTLFPGPYQMTGRGDSNKNVRDMGYRCPCPIRPCSHTQIRVNFVAIPPPASRVEYVDVAA